MGASTAFSCIRRSLRKLNETAERIDGVAEWRSSELYTKRERAALAWTEAVTNIQEGHAPDVVYDEVRAHFSDVETVNLTLAITTINAWNRIAISLGAYPGHAGAANRWRDKWLSERMKYRGLSTRAAKTPPPVEMTCLMRGTLQPLPEVPERTVVLRAEGLTKVYAAVSGAAGRGELELFRGLDLTVHAGEMVAIVGESGAGKSSLLHLLAALDKPTAGEVWCGESRLSSFTARQAAEFRNRDVGYVWQFHYLLPEFTALENVAMPCWPGGWDGRRRWSGRGYWLGEVGLAERAEHRSRRAERRGAAEGDRWRGRW